MVAIAGGSDHTVALLENGLVYGCGSQSFGQLGTQLQRTRNNFENIAVGCPYGVQEIAAGRYFTLFVCERNPNVLACGSNTYGQLGIGFVAQSVFTPHLIPRLSGRTNADVAHVYAGDEFAAALLMDGSVVSWGRNAEGQQGRLSLLAVDSLSECYDADDHCARWANDGLCPSMSEGRRLQCSYSCELPHCTTAVSTNYLQPKVVLDAGTSVSC